MPINPYRVKILKVEQVTQDTKSFVFEKPEGFSFMSGQSVFVAIDSDEWREQKRQFTLASNPKSENLELIIKIYPERQGVTAALDKLMAGDYLLISKPFGLLNYKSEVRNVFIAAGSAITKFLSLLRSLSDDDLSNIVFIYSNKAKNDIIREDELKKIFKKHPKNLVLVLTRENIEGYHHGRINEELLRDYIKKTDKVITAGPDDFVKEVMEKVRKIRGD